MSYRQNRPADAIELGHHIGSVFDEPNSDSSCLSTFLLSGFARERVTEPQDSFDSVLRPDCEMLPCHRELVGFAAGADGGREQHLSRWYSQHCAGR